MNITDKNVNEYLNQVGSYLKGLNDKDQILQELKAHIWDLAHDISEEENVSVTQAFEITLTRMEEPETLANRFLSEFPELGDKYTPEKKITEQQFLLIGVIGFLFVGFASAIFTIISNESWIFWVFTLIPGIVLAVSVLGFLYFKDEKEFQEQMEVFRGEIRRHFIVDKEIKPTGFWGAFRTHMGGLLGALAVLLTIILVFWIDVTGVLPLFNENWYMTGAFACYIAWVSSLIAYLAQFFLGQIRISRLITAADNTLGGLCLITLFLAYPFTIGQALVSLFGSNIPNLLVNADFFLHIIFGIATIVMIISAIYSFFKFGVWQPEEKKSLL